MANAILVQGSGTTLISARLKATIDANYKLTLEGAASTTTMFGLLVTGDTVNRFVVNASGKISWGPGSGAADATLERAVAGVLSAASATGTNYLASIRVTGSTLGMGYSVLNTNASFANPFTTSFVGGFTTGDPINADFAGGIFPRIATTGGVVILGVGTKTPGLALVGGITTEDTTDAPMSFNVGKNSAGSGAAITSTNLAYSWFNNNTLVMTMRGDGTLAVGGTTFGTGNVWVGTGTDAVGSGIVIAGAGEGTSTAIEVILYGVVGNLRPSMQCLGAAGTHASPTAVVLGDRFGNFEAWGYDGTGFRIGGRIYWTAQETWSSTARGCSAAITTNKAGTITERNCLVINDDGRVEAVVSTGTNYKANIISTTGDVQNGFAIYQTNASFSNPFTVSTADSFNGGTLDADFSAGLFNWSATGGGAALIGVSDDAGVPAVAIEGNKGVGSTTIGAIRLNAATQTAGTKADIAATDWLMTVSNNQTGIAVWFGDGTYEVSTEGLFAKIGNGVLQIHAADGGVGQMIRIEATQANVTTADVFIEYRSTTGVEGSVAGTAVAGVIAYNTFTGSHWSQASSNDVPTSTPPGTVLISTSAICEWDGEVADHLPKCLISSSAADKAVYGVFGGHDADGDIVVIALGAAKIRVNDEGGAIEIGDLLCTSATAGVAKKYTGTDMAVVIAKARSAHSAAGEVTIPCTMMAG